MFGKPRQSSYLCNVFLLTQRHIAIYHNVMGHEQEEDLRKTEGAMFASGDQDYATGADWDPVKENIAKMEAESRKKDPRGWAEAPEMLFVQRAQYFVETGAQGGPMPQLFGPFWLMEEMAILFSPPGVGKSVLATQIAESLARGVPFAPFSPRTGPKVPPQRVLYIDFEMDLTQFAQRYSIVGEDGITLENKYQLSPELLRAENHWNGKMIEGYEDYTDMLFEDIGRQVYAHEATVLIIDNISHLTRGSTAHAAVAFRLMERLRYLKFNQFISILTIAHTPKQPRFGHLTESDMQGSIDLSKVADSVIALGRSRQSTDLRYLKQVKYRSGRIEHGENNVALFRLHKFDFASHLQTEGAETGHENFLGFEFDSFVREEDHFQFRFQPSARIKGRSRKDHYLARRVKELSAEGLSFAAIAKTLGVGNSTAHRYMGRIPP